MNFSHHSFKDTLALLKLMLSLYLAFLIHLINSYLHTFILDHFSRGFIPFCFTSTLLFFILFFLLIIILMVIFLAYLAYLSYCLIYILFLKLIHNPSIFDPTCFYFLLFILCYHLEVLFHHFWYYFNLIIMFTILKRTLVSLL